jgi:hypothetical protein
VKEVTLTSAPEGETFVVVGGVRYQLGEPVVVTENEATRLDSATDHKFKVQDAPKGARRGDTADVTADSGGTGGSTLGPGDHDATIPPTTP